MITMNKFSCALFFGRKPQMWPLHKKKNCLILILGPLWCCAPPHYSPHSTWRHTLIFKKKNCLIFMNPCYEFEQQFSNNLNYTILQKKEKNNHCWIWISDCRPTYFLSDTNSHNLNCKYKSAGWAQLMRWSVTLVGESERTQMGSRASWCLAFALRSLLQW